MIAAVACILLWGLIPVVSILGQKGLDAFQFLFWSNLISGVTLATLTLLFRAKNKPSTREMLRTLSVQAWLKLTALGLLGTFFYYLCLYYGYANANSLQVLAVQYTWPAWVLVFALLIDKQPLHWTHLVTIAAGILSVYLVISRGDLTQLSIPQWDVLLLVLIGASGFAWFSVSAKHVQMPALPLNTLFFAVATVASLIAMLLASSPTIPDQQAWLPLLVNGVFVNGISYYLWVRALRAVQPIYIALLTFLTPLVSMIYVVAFFQEAFEWVYLLAFSLVLMSGLLSQRFQPKTREAAL